MQTSPESSRHLCPSPPFLRLIRIRLQMRGVEGGVINVYMTYISKYMKYKYMSKCRVSLAFYCRAFSPVLFNFECIFFFEKRCPAFYPRPLFTQNPLHMFHLISQRLKRLQI